MSASRDLHPETRLVHAGTLRSQFGEVSRGDALIQGFVYHGAEQSEARSKRLRQATCPASRTRR
jgi:O-succinylhomoserine sulfhydrylase